MPCKTCRGTGKVYLQSATHESDEDSCDSCDGTGVWIDPEREKRRTLEKLNGLY